MMLTLVKGIFDLGPHLISHTDLDLVEVIVSLWILFIFEFCLFVVLSSLQIYKFF